MKRAAFIIVMLGFCFGSFAERRPATIRGTVLLEGDVLPGTSVRLLVNNDVVATAVTDKDGAYTIGDVPRGWYDLEASMPGLASAVQVVVVDGEDVTAKPMALEFIVIDEPITIACGSPCDGEGQESCDDYDENRELEAKAARDQGALERLMDRYGKTRSREERARIGGFLVGVLEDDEEYFRPLAKGTEQLLALAERSDDDLREEQPDYVAWCNLTGRDPDKELWLLFDEATAMFHSTDPRAVGYAHRALRVHDLAVRFLGFDLASLTCDASLLHAILEELDSPPEREDLYPFVQLIPCEDQTLNEVIMAADREYVASMLPDIIALRDEELARLRRPAR